MKRGVFRSPMGFEDVSREEYEAVYSGQQPFLVLSEATWEYEVGDFIGLHERGSDSPTGVGRSVFVRVTRLYRGDGVVPGYVVLGCERVNIEA